eukprot:299221-Chlamydomonas_euryale.AAC.1
MSPAHAQCEALCLALYGCCYVDLQTRFGPITEVSRMWFLSWRSTPNADQLNPHVQAAMGVVAPGVVGCSKRPSPVLV